MQVQSGRETPIPQWRLRTVLRVSAYWYMALWSRMNLSIVLATERWCACEPRRLPPRRAHSEVLLPPRPPIDDSELPPDALAWLFIVAMPLPEPPATPRAADEPPADLECC